MYTQVHGYLIVKLAKIVVFREGSELALDQNKFTGPHPNPLWLRVCIQVLCSMLFTLSLDNVLKIQQQYKLLLYYVIFL